MIKKLASSGQIDSTYQPCSSIHNLVDVVYDYSNPALLFGLTELTNELILFSALTAKQECQVSAKMALSDVTDRTVFDSLRMFGSLLVARSMEDASLHLFRTKPDDQLSFMVSAVKPLPAVFKMPKCGSESDNAVVHLGDYFVADASLMTVEPCPGKILTV